MSGLEDRSNGDGELLFAVRTVAQARANLLGGVVGNGGELGLVVALTLGADNAVFPKDAFKMQSGLVVGVEAADDLD